MNENRLIVPITSTLCPDYYPDFHCAAGNCHYNCCQDWCISFSKKDYLALKRAPRTPELKARMEKALQRMRGDGMGKEGLYAQFRLDKNDSPCCPLQSQSGLCLLQLECGEEALPHVCRDFPRLGAYSAAGAYEQACSTGCEVVTAALLERQDGLTFLQTTLPPEKQKNMSFLNPAGLLQWFGPIRELCIDILQDRSHPLSRRLLLLGLALRELQTRQEQDKLTEIDSWLAYSRMLLTDESVHATLGELKGNKKLFVVNNLNQFLSIPSNAPHLSALRREIFLLLKLRDGEEQSVVAMDTYNDAEAHFFATFDNLEYLFENILVNIFFHQGHPNLSQPSHLWDSYVNFCNLYSLFRFLAICGCAQEQTKDRLIHVLTVASRVFLHDNNAVQSELTFHYEHENSNSLAHMAILVCG